MEKKTGKDAVKPLVSLCVALLFCHYSTTGFEWIKSGLQKIDTEKIIEYENLDLSKLNFQIKAEMPLFSTHTETETPIEITQTIAKAPYFLGSPDAPILLSTKIETPREAKKTSDKIDDRNWTPPTKNTKGALPVRSVTMLAQNSNGDYIADGRVTVNNDTDFSIDIPNLLKNDILKPAVNNKPQILIIHTHASESYLPDATNYYVPSDIQRTEDTRYNVVRLGDEMKKIFESNGLNVIHNREIIDYPSYNGSYARALDTIQNTLQKYPSIQIVLDLHRDAIEDNEGTMFKTINSDGNKAQMMFVVGSAGLGLPHDGWRNNLSFAAIMQQKLLTKDPTIMRPIHLRNERFNQHSRPASLILETGTAANSLDEAIASIKFFSETIAPYFVSEFGK